MPLNFPDNPVDNQVYSPTPQKAWVYNASQGTWLASNVSSQGTKVTVQDAAPQGSDQGDLWFNSETGSLNVNYDDTSSEQWVNISSSGIIESEDVINDNTMLTASESTLATSSSIKAYVDSTIGSTFSLDDVQMFNFRTNGGVSKGYIESGDISQNYRGSLPITFDSDVDFVELEYTTSLANPAPYAYAEDSTNGTVYIDWKNKKIKQSSLRKEGDAGHYQHWYESTQAESNGLIMFNTPDTNANVSNEGIIINWDTRQITGLPAYNRTYSNGSGDGDASLPPYETQYVFQDITKSGAGGGGEGGGSSLLRYGTIDVGNPGPITGGAVTTTGDFTTIDTGNDGNNFYDIFECTFNSPLPNNNYNVVFELISNGSVNDDGNMRYPIITDKTATGFTFSIEEGPTAIQDLEINVRIESNQANAVIADQKWEAVTDGTYNFDQASNLETSEYTNSTGSPLVIRGQFTYIDQEQIQGDDDISVSCIITHAGETASVTIPFASEVGFNDVSPSGGGYSVDVGSITIPAGATYKFTRNNDDYDVVSWYKMTTTAVAGSSSGGGSALLEENGYQILPSGMIMQWGKVSHGSGGSSVVFPIPFPNACFNVTGELIGDDVEANLGITSISQTGFFMNPLVGSTSYWQAIGW